MSSHYLLRNKAMAKVLRQRSSFQMIPFRGKAHRTEAVGSPTLTAQRRDELPFGFLPTTSTTTTSAIRNPVGAPSGWGQSIVSSSPKRSLKNSRSLSSAGATSSSSFELSTSENEEDSKLLQVDLEELQKLASLRCTPLSLSDMYKYAVDFNNKGQRLLNAQFLHKELPIRLAQRAVDLLTLPHGLSDTAPIRKIAHVYLLYLEKFQEFPIPTTNDDEDRFTDMLQSIILDKSSIPNAIAQGVDTWLHSAPPETDSKVVVSKPRAQELEDALYRFFTARVGLRFLTEHHILSSPQRTSPSDIVRQSQSKFQNNDNETFLGCIKKDCDPSREVRKVAEEVRQQTEEFYGMCPQVEIVESTLNADAEFTYVPHHLHYMVRELLNNSCRATVQRYLEKSQQEDDTDSVLHPIRVVIVQGEEDVTIKFEDRGGGIPRSNMATIWRFAHSTTESEEPGGTSDFGVDDVEGSKIRGFGLPLARIYARYLGGELTLKSTEGYGLDAYLHLTRLGDCCENLPLDVKYSPGELYSDPPRNVSQDNRR